MNPAGSEVFIDRVRSGGQYELEKWDIVKKSRHSILTTTEERTSVGAITLNASAGRFAVSAVPFQEEKPRIDCWTLSDKPTKIAINPRLAATALDFSPDGKTLAAGYPDGSVAWYDTASGKIIKQLPAFARLSVGSVEFHPSGKYIACGTFDTGKPNLFFVSVETGEVVTVVLADKGGVTGVCFSPAGDRVAAFGASGTVTIWDATKLLKLKPE